MIGLGSLFFTCFSVIQSGGALGRLLQPLSGPGVWGSIFYLAAFSSVGAFFLLNYAFSYLNLAQASIFTNLVTVVSIAAGIVFLRGVFYRIAGDWVHCNPDRSLSVLIYKGMDRIDRDRREVT